MYSWEVFGGTSWRSPSTLQCEIFFSVISFFSRHSAKHVNAISFQAEQSKNVVFLEPTTLITVNKHHRPIWNHMSQESAQLPIITCKFQRFFKIHKRKVIHRNQDDCTTERWTHYSRRSIYFIAMGDLHEKGSWWPFLFCGLPPFFLFSKP